MRTMLVVGIVCARARMDPFFMGPVSVENGPRIVRALYVSYFSPYLFTITFGPKTDFIVLINLSEQLCCEKIVYVEI